jgi:hypothetical protein
VAVKEKQDSKIEIGGREWCENWEGLSNMTTGFFRTYLLERKR